MDILEAVWFTPWHIHRCVSRDVSEILIPTQRVTAVEDVGCVMQLPRGWLLESLTWVQIPKTPKKSSLLLEARCVWCEGSGLAANSHVAILVCMRVGNVNKY